MLEPTVTVIVELPEPGAAIEEGLKLADAPEGRPETLKEIAELKPPEMLVLMVLAPEDPWLTVSVDGDAEMVKLGGVPESTVSDNIAD